MAHPLAGQIARVERAFRELIDEAEEEERAWREQARVIFLTVVSAGLRAGEVRGLRWRDVSLADPAGATLRADGTRRSRTRPRPECRLRR